MATLPIHTGALPRGELLGRYRSYEDAQKVVDHLVADHDFDVKALTIVGNDLRSVEKVRARLSYPRVAGTGALQGALFGAFMGLLLMLFAPEAPLLNLAMAVLMGMAIWMIIGVVSFAARRGTRGFVSASQLTATTYDVVCDFQVAQRARQLVPGAGVTSLNALNDPTGQRSALSTPARDASTHEAAAQTRGQPTAQPLGPNSTSPPAEAPSTQVQSHEKQAQSLEENAASPGRSETADHAERTGAAQQWQQPDGRPRYGVRLDDAQQQSQRVAEEPDPDPAEGSADRQSERTSAPDEENTRA
ncbi:general stress protein [Nesterenkonia natronophila]|uniref:General stress protein 17M-like domain-containing protein n=1 Tax=Nesterenkonia natronophila TaxID=2174932 RepID=A0A3A4FKF4_9MICC|nr:general stress protein [Nesterenkonia natronophila]RJN32885.1 hypothetical protein D3250_03470 [Nesterenkonia natronophila]